MARNREVSKRKKRIEATARAVEKMMETRAALIDAHKLEFGRPGRGGGRVSDPTPGAVIVENLNI